jgi:nitric oxide reductase NorQ protein
MDSVHQMDACISAPDGRAPTAAVSEPFYRPVAREVELFATCFARKLPVLLKGPTGVGKSRFIEYMAWRLGRSLITVACHDDLSSSDLTGRYLIKGGDTVWVDGPLTRAVRTGAICYLDELVEARQDTTVVVHPLTDHRRLLPIEKTGELLHAAPGFMLVASYNPGYQRAIKDLKPSTRQRFVTIEFDFPPPAIEVDIVTREGGVSRRTAKVLVEIGERVRRLRDQGLPEGPGTRLLVAAAQLIAQDIPPREACDAAIAKPLSDDRDLLAAIADVIDVSF